MPLLNEATAMILGLLSSQFAQGMYGSELVARSDGFLKRGSIYNQLDRLIAMGYVEEKVDPPSPERMTQRTRHVITATGASAYSAFMDRHLALHPFAQGAL